jgi:hypothetical protein
VVPDQPAGFTRIPRFRIPRIKYRRVRPPVVSGRAFLPPGAEGCGVARETSPESGTRSPRYRAAQRDGMGSRCRVGIPGRSGYRNRTSRGSLAIPSHNVTILLPTVEDYSVEMKSGRTQGDLVLGIHVEDSYRRSADGSFSG